MKFFDYLAVLGLLLIAAGLYLVDLSLMLVVVGCLSLFTSFLLAYFNAQHAKVRSDAG